MSLKKGRIQKAWGFLTGVLDIPDVTATGESGRGTGFTVAQTEKISPTTNGVPLSRERFNQVLGETQEAVKDIQNTGSPAWYSNADNNNVDMNYPRGAKVWHNNRFWVSKIANNNTEPSVANAAFWSDFDFFDKAVVQNDSRALQTFSFPANAPSSRGLFQNFTNSEAHPILLTVSVQLTHRFSVPASLSVFVDGTLVAFSAASSNSSAGYVEPSLTTFVPPGSIYRVDVSNTSLPGSFVLWTEFR